LQNQTSAGSLQASPRAARTEQASFAAGGESQIGGFIAPPLARFDCQGNSSTSTLRKTLFFDVKLDLQAGVRLSSAFRGHRPTLHRFPSPFFFARATITNSMAADVNLSYLFCGVFCINQYGAHSVSAFLRVATSSRRFFTAVNRRPFGVFNAERQSHLNADQSCDRVSRRAQASLFATPRPR